MDVHMSAPKREDFTPEAWELRQAEIRATKARRRLERAEAAAIDDPADAIAHADSFPRPEMMLGEPVGFSSDLGSAATETLIPSKRLGSPADAGFQLFCLRLDPARRELVGEAELRRIYAEQSAKADAERRSAAKKEATEEALKAARMAMGLVPQDAVEALELARFNAAPMSMRIQLPPADENGNPADIGLRIDNKIYLDGRVANVTRAQFDSMREIVYRADQMEQEFLGVGKRRRAFYQAQRLGHDPRWHVESGGEA